MKKKSLLINPSELEDKWGNVLIHYAEGMYKSIDARRKAESEDARFKEEYSQLYMANLPDKEKEDKVFDLIEKYYPIISRCL